MKKNNTRALLLVIFVFIFCSMRAENGIVGNDMIYKSSIHTVQLHRLGAELTPPIIRLNTDEQLKLSFDDFDSDVKRYKFTVIHCTADWYPSDVQPSDYILGFTNDYITDYRFSLNTTIKYTHYNLVFPSDNFQIIQDGNYLLEVFDENDPDNIVFTRRFMIVDQKVSVSATVNRSLAPAERDVRQRIVFNINALNYPISNYQNLKVIVSQNGRWDNSITGLRPKTILGNVLSYDYDEGNEFNGGNEFRHFDIKSLRYQSDRVQRLNFDTAYQVYLLPDERRTFKSYFSDKDIDGLYLIKTEDGNNSETESDYCIVHFCLPYSAPMVGGNIYVFGGMVYWQYMPEAEMKYNFKKSQYEATLLLKQGYYNYQYVWLENGKSGDETFIEGNHFETENNYTIRVYYREPGSFMDKLIGIESIYSVK